MDLVLRATVVFFLIMVVTRVVGRRELSSLQPFDLILLVVVLLVFGPKRLPEMGRSLGKGMRGFKTAITGKDDDDDRHELPAPQPPETVAASTAPREHDTV